MARVNAEGYLEWASWAGHSSKSDKRGSWKDWAIVLHGYHVKTSKGRLCVGTVNFPKEYVGKKIKLKVEVVGR